METKEFFKNPLNDYDTEMDFIDKVLTNSKDYDYDVFENACNRLHRIIVKTNQKNRLIRLYLLAEIYHKYKHIHLNSSILNSKNTWQQAEKTADFINMLMPNRNASPNEFIHNSNKLSDKILDEYKEYEEYIRLCELREMSKKSVEAFCKKMEYCGDRLTSLNSYFGMHYPYFLISIHAYFNEKITKSQLLDEIQFFMIISNKTKKFDTSIFRKALIEIEMFYFEIEKKQSKRASDKKYGKQLTIKWGKFQ